MKFGTKYIRNFGYVNNLYEDKHTFTELYLRILGLGIIPVGSFGVNLNTYFMLNLCFSKTVSFKETFERNTINPNRHKIGWHRMVANDIAHV
jgi:hypothetical protein